MTFDEKIILWFKELTKQDIAKAGGKGANLGELTQAQVPVPAGFVVSADAYYRFLEESGLKDYIAQQLASLDTNDSQRLREVAKQIMEKIIQAPMPSEIAVEIAAAYEKLSGGLVAVRSSATAEDLPEASFAGQQRTFLNVAGKEEVIRAVQACWASLFEPRAIFYRTEHGFDHLGIGIAVPVQQMVQSEVSGVMFTIEPVGNDENKILIEAVFGLGEAIVSGEVTPDLYVVNKRDMQLVETRLGHQDWQLVKNPLRSKGQGDGTTKVYLTPSDQSRAKLTEEEILRLARWGQKIEELYHFPQDIEWAKRNGGLFILPRESFFKTPDG
ncbi:MAG: PEP/pyruvate-binding domain-containing protein, partial [Chloroflexota bacterium]